MAKYAPTAAQAQTVVAYLRAQGFTNIDVAPKQPADQRDRHRRCPAHRVQGRPARVQRRRPPRLRERHRRDGPRAPVQHGERRRRPAERAPDAHPAATRGQDGRRHASHQRHQHPELPGHLRRVEPAERHHRHHRHHHVGQADADHHRPEELRLQRRLPRSQRHDDRGRHRRHQHVGHRRMEHGLAELAGRGRRHDRGHDPVQRQLAERRQPGPGLQQGRHGQQGARDQRLAGRLRKRRRLGRSDAGRDLRDGRLARPDVLRVVGRLRRLRVRRDRRQGAELPGRFPLRHGRRRHHAVDHRFHLDG